MIDVTCSLLLVSLVVAVAAAYAVRVARRGAAHFRRVDQDGGSPLLGRSVMEMGYWALEPLGQVLARAGVSANAVTLASLAVGVAAGVALALGHFGVAALLVAVAALGDVLDGAVARASGTTSRAGAVLDSTVDRYQEFAFLGGVAVHYRDQPAWLLLALLALLGAVMTSYVSAKAEGLSVAVPRGAMRRNERAVYLALGALLTPLAAAYAARRGLAPAWGHAPMVAALGLVAAVANVSAALRLAALVAALRPPAVRRAERARDLAAQVGRHQACAAAATAVDFAVMILAVEALGVGAVPATALGAASGAAVSFALGRRWGFRATGDTVAAQAARHAFVSAVSLALNAMGEHWLHDGAGLHYAVARVAVSGAVSLLWNFPLQRRFVFREPEPYGADAVGRT